ncbi:Putative short-chain dehydrogenase/reductase SDR, NAD(P)-binding domain superfamily [Colletotrichum destructivum]|uniref:Short-chain dehydrogenase/reductase SDR, NAD(P)-binding domain superfamily n=1 Tax=Colletotrichum destructivum TaxID=34406 RepID=A0AAX4I7X4_9PEZI|nr:Putative short-chain dehydrogenase/reductase SDR, NAD(P)-binding domain superfamily [Colletotrichum destructivum]
MGIPANMKTVLITGCTPGGIGHALAKEFHGKGLHVIATARRPEVLKDLSDLGLTTLPLDVTNAESIAACKKNVTELTGGRLDFLVNNAGLTHTVPATDIDMDEVRQTFETNVFGVMAMVQAFVPLLIPARGLIIMISSLSSISPYVFGSVYTATKGALNSYSRTLRQELRPFGVRVMVSMTGTVKSQIAKLNRELPPNSLYARAKDVYVRRLTFSQNNATVSTEEFAQQLVAEALKGEGWLGGWLGGARNWFWAGGMAGTVWFVRLFFGEWLLDELSYRKFELPKLEAIVKKEGVKRSD